MTPGAVSSSSVVFIDRSSNLIQQKFKQKYLEFPFRNPSQYQRLGKTQEAVGRDLKEEHEAEVEAGR